MSHTWNMRSTNFGTNITYQCLAGNAVKDMGGNWTEIISNLCGYQEEDQYDPYFLYNSSNPLSACQRK